MIVGITRNEIEIRPGDFLALLYDELEYEGWLQVEYGKYEGMYIKDDFEQ